MPSSKYNIEFQVHQLRRSGRTAAKLKRSFKTRKEAEAFADKLRKRGTQAYIVEAHSEKGLGDALPRWVR